MKKISILFLCLFMMMFFNLSIFAATSCEEWLNEAQIDEVEKRAEDIFSNEVYKATETHVYPMYHITDDAFFKKLMLWNKMSSFISQKYDFGIFSDSWLCTKPVLAEAEYYTQKTGSMKSVFTLNIAEYQKFNEFLANVDSHINAGDFGIVKDVSLLYGDFISVNINGADSSLYLCFAYIQSDRGEFFVPYTFLQTVGEPILENGKIYTLKECTTIMKKSISFSEDSRTETTNVLYPWQVVLIAVLGVAALVGAFFGIKALIERGKTRVNTRSDF